MSIGKGRLPNQSGIGASRTEATMERIAGIDTARGIALLGIFFVNAQLFGQPFAKVLEPNAPASEGWLSHIVYWFTSIFCTGKFYPLFSILFGVGLAMMYQSSVRRVKALVDLLPSVADARRFRHLAHSTFVAG